MVSRQIELDSSELRVLDTGDGPPLLFVHGFPLDHSMWSGQLDDFARDYRVLAPDLPGFGQSSPILAPEYTMEMFADDLAAMLDRLAIDDSVIFCGLSMGGYVAWQFWHRHRERLRALIVCDSRAAADSPEVARGRSYMAERVLEQGSTSVADEMLTKLFASETVAAKPKFVGHTLDVMKSTRRETIASAQRGMAIRPDMTSHLDQIQVPSLLLAGEQDVISTPREMDSLAKRMPIGEFATIPNAGHLAPLERPDVANGLMRSFLEKVVA